MTHVLGDAGRAMLKAFWASFIVVAIGITTQTNLDNTLAFGVAGLMAVIGSVLAAFQVFVPQISFRAYVPDPWGPMIDSFFHAAVGAFIVAIAGWLAEPNYSTGKATIIAAVIGAINAGFRALQGLGTTGEQPAPQKGVKSGAVSSAGAPKRVLSPA